MTTSDKLLAATKEIWESYNAHPFVLGIQNGDLDKEKLRYYIMQDFVACSRYEADFWQLAWEQKQ